TQVLLVDSVHCRDVFKPFYLSTLQPLPDFLKCDYTKPQCLICDSLVSLTNQFKSIFSTPYNGGPVFNTNDLSDVQIKQNVLFGRFLNYRTCFQYTWMQYAEAAAGVNCGASTNRVV